MKKFRIPIFITFFFLLVSSVLLVIVYEKNNSDEKDKEILAFFDEWDDVTPKIVQKIEAGDVDGARLLFDSKKEIFRSGWKKIPRSRSGGSGKIYMSATVKKRYLESYNKNISAINDTRFSFASKFGNDKAKLEKLENLITEHGDIFK